MGGPVPLGYQVSERKLIPVPDEADRVRTIMRLYLASSNTDDLLAQLDQKGIRTKLRKVGKSTRGGIPFKRGSLFHLLGNAIYIGMIVHKGKAYPGEHPAIIDQALWEPVQAKLKSKAPARKRPTNSEQVALLKGLLIDPQGRPMVPTFTCKGTRRYRYYETRRDLAKPADPKPTRFAMAGLDKHITDALKTLLGDEHRLRRICGVISANAIDAIHGSARKTLGELGGDPSGVIQQLISSIKIEDEQILISLRSSGLDLDESGHEITRAIPLPSRKSFGEHRIRLNPESAHHAQPDPDLVSLLKEAHAAQKLIFSNPQTSLSQLAQKQGQCRKRMAKLLQLSWLSPTLVSAIVDGRQSPSLTRAQLLDCALPVAWDDQDKLLKLS